MRLGMKHINYDKVIVEWLDIQSCDNPWNTLDEFDKLLPAKCTTIGYLYEDNKDYIKTFATYSINENSELDIDVGDAVVIPRGCIVSIKKIEN